MSLERKFCISDSCFLCLAHIDVEFVVPHVVIMSSSMW